MFYKRLLFYFQKYLSTILLGVVFVILSNLSRAFTPKLVQELIDNIIAQLKTSSNTNMLKPMVIEFVLLYLGLTLLSALFTFLMRQTIVVTSHKIQYNLKNDLYKHIQAMKMEEYNQFTIGDFMSRMAEDIGKIRELFGPGVMYTINLITTLSITIYFMVSVNAELAFYALLPLPLLSISVFYINNYSYKFNKKSQEILSSLTSQAQESYNGIRIIKSFTLEKKMNKKFKKLSGDYKAQEMQIVKLSSLFLPISTFLISISILLTMYIGGKMYMNGEISIGHLTEFIMYVQNLTWPVLSVGWVANLYQRGKASLDRYEEIMSKELEEYSINQQNSDIKGSIKFDQLSYRYSNTGILALNDVSFEIPFGEKWQIVGKTGSGKTTLAELLMKFYTQYDGHIWLNNRELKEIPKDEVRNNISYIPQDVFLFSESVRNNIAFSDNMLSEEIIKIAAQNAQIDNEINTFAHKYDTMIGERGVTLSGGQKQRISIARALVKPSPIYLFDDCLSAVDVDTERKLIQAIEKHNEENTLIMISHRIFNQLKFDKIMVLHEGKIVELGTKEELMNKQGYYYELYKKQELKMAKTNQN